MKQETTAEESAQDEQETGNTETEASGKDSNEKTEEASRDLFAMDTYMTLTAYGEHAQEAVDKAAERAEALDALLSTGDENSEIYQLNQKGEATLSEDGGYLVERALELYHLVLKKCPAQNQRMRDVLVYPEREPLQPEEQLFVQLLHKQADATIKDSGWKKV